MRKQTERCSPLKRSVRILASVAGLAVVGTAFAADQERTQVVTGEQQVQQTQGQGMEERLQHQEQRITDLEQRLQDLEAAAMAGKAPAPAPDTSPAAAPAAAEPPKTERLEVSAVEARETHQVLTGGELTSKEFPGSWPMFGSDYRMKIGGYFKLDALYDIDGTGDKFQFPISQIPVNGTPEAGRGGYLNMFVKETRFNFDIRKTTSGDPPQQVFVEMDFFDENSSSPRLRHAYVVYGNLVMGQTWGTLFEGRAMPFIIDFAYGDMLYGGRTTQVRWQQQLGKNWAWAAAVEMMNSSGIDNPLALPGVASQALPVLTARATYEDSSTVVMFGGAVTRLRWDSEGAGPNAAAPSWVMVLSGRQSVGARDYFTWNFSFGEGSAENISALAGGNANATLLPGGHLQTNRSTNGSIGYARKLTDSLTTNLAYAQTELAAHALRASDSIKGGSVVHVNLIKAVTKAMSTGIEYMWGERENTDHAKGRAARVQSMVKYDF